MSDWIRQNAPAKINLSLHVTGQRKDGFHTLESLVVFAKLADALSARPSDRDKYEIAGPFASQLTSGSTNLVLQAIDLFRQTWPAGLPQALEVQLTKNLPVSAGLGGGSSDAAAMLRILQQMSPVSIAPKALRELAGALGADVPVCVSPTPQIMGGVGKELTRLGAPFPKVDMVLINPIISVSTPTVFSALKQKNNPPPPSLPDAFPGIDPLIRWLKETRNDLYEPASQLVPQIEEIADFLARQTDCLLARMSGSGATVFGLFETAGEAKRAGLAAQKIWPDYWVEQTCTR